MTDNLAIWKKVARPPLSALKTIKGGRLSGMSNISPQWRWQAMTEQFGMIGFGWKYTVEKRWTSPGADEEHFAFAEILLYYKVDGEWSAPIPGEGGSVLVAKERNGYHNNDEAFKMAVTDALGTAMAKIGVGADIYLGTFDGSKYNEPQAFAKKVDGPKDVVKHTQKSEETPPTIDSVPVDEAFPKGDLEKNEALSVADLYKIPNMDKIKACGADVPTILETLKSLDKKQNYTIEYVKNLITGAKQDG